MSERDVLDALGLARTASAADERLAVVQAIDDGIDEIRSLRDEVERLREVCGWLRISCERALRDLGLRDTAKPTNVLVFWHTSVESVEQVLALAGEEDDGTD